MRLRHLLLASTALVVSAPAWAADIVPTVDIVTDRATDIRGIAFAADGKIYGTGNAGATRPELTTVIMRFNADGSLDPSWGDNGVATLDLADEAPLPDGRRRQQSFGIAELENGDVVITVHALDAQSGQSIYLVRLDSTGKQLVAPAFGDERGKVEVVFGWANADNAEFTGSVGPVDSAWNLWVDPTNPERVVVTGHGPAPKGSGRTDLDRYVVRLNAVDGSVDHSFNGGQPVHFHSVGTQVDNVRRSTIEPDGSIVTAGFTNFGDELGQHVVVIRILADGTLDPAFGGFIEPAKSAEASGMAPVPGVAILNPFQADGGMSEAYAAVRTADGGYITSGPGEATAEGGSSTLGYVGSAAGDLVSFRIAGNALDTTWGNNGTQAIQSEGAAEDADDSSSGAVILPDGRTVHAGGYGGVAAAIVLTADGQLDTSVSDDGIIELPNDTVTVPFNAAIISPDGKRVALTSDFDAAGMRLVVLEVQ